MVATVITIIRRRPIVSVERFETASRVLGEDTECRGSVIRSRIVLKAVDRTIRRGQGVEFEGLLNVGERHLDDVRVVAVVLTEGTARVEESARLSELNNRRVVRLLKVDLEGEPLDLAAPDDVDICDGDTTTVTTDNVESDEQTTPVDGRHRHERTRESCRAPYRRRTNPRNTC